MRTTVRSPLAWSADAVGCVIAALAGRDASCRAAAEGDADVLPGEERTTVAQQRDR
jgi:hypothetical protein